MGRPRQADTTQYFQKTQQLHALLRTQLTSQHREAEKQPANPQLLKQAASDKDFLCSSHPPRATLTDNEVLHRQQRGRQDTTTERLQQNHDWSPPRPQTHRWLQPSAGLLLEVVARCLVEDLLS